VARRRGAGQSAARVPMRAAKTRKPTAACGFGSRLPQNSPALIYARVPFVGATSGAARTTSVERRRGSSKRPCSRAARMTHACRSSTGSRRSMIFETGILSAEGDRSRFSGEGERDLLLTAPGGRAASDGSASVGRRDSLHAGAWASSRRLCAPHVFAACCGCGCELCRTRSPFMVQGTGCRGNPSG